MVLGSFNTASGKYCCNVIEYAKKHGFKNCFNTASGKYCCNVWISCIKLLEGLFVSIPQAVSTVATEDLLLAVPYFCEKTFQYRKR